MSRKHVIGAVLALAVCGFVVGWIVASGTARAPEPVSGSPYGSARVLELPGTVKPLDPQFLTPKTARPVPSIPQFQEHLRKFVACKDANKAGCVAVDLLTAQ